MKVQCDVCEKAEATVLCCADEASLCAECDTRVHAANKLASKHQRVPLLYPSPQDLPSCDICQEKTGYFFCLEDRALLCRNCDYSIHSANLLAANHKRFLVSGIRVALQVISANDGLESTQVSPSQVTSPTTQISQLSSPTAQVSQSSSVRTGWSQKAASVSSLPSKAVKSTTRAVPHDSSSLFAHTTREESLSQVPSLSVTKQEQQSQHVAQLTEPQQLLGVTSAIDGNSTVAFTPASTGRRQSQFIAGQQLSDWVNANPNDVRLGETSTSPRGGGGGMRGSSISEYLTESLPGWRVDELLNLPAMDPIYKFAESGASKADASLFTDEDWTVACDIQGLGEAVIGEVPSLPSPPTFSGVPRSTKPPWGFQKSLTPSDLDFLLQCDDTLVVPDIGGDSLAPSMSPSVLAQKRRRASAEFLMEV